jgi:uncharacterized membrane protein YphA (DoxX/SURF4 family)
VHSGDPLAAPAGPSDMAISALDKPSWVGVVLQSPVVRFLIRLALVSSYLIGGLTKVSSFPSAVAEQAHFGLHPPAAWAVMAIIIELGASAMVLLNRFVWLSAGGLGVLTAVAMLVANDFWTMEGHARFMALNSFFEHLGLIAALVLATILAQRHRLPPTDP